MINIVPKVSFFSLLFLPYFLPIQTLAQSDTTKLPQPSPDSTYARRMIDTLCSPFMHGRGYVNSGDMVAAEFISSELKKSGVSSFLFETYMQPFPVPVNTFPVSHISFEKTMLEAGKDYLLYPFSSGIKKGNYKVFLLNKGVVEDEAAYTKFKQQDLASGFIMIDKTGITDSVKIKFMESMVHNPLSAKGIIWITEEKLTNSLAAKEADYPAIKILKSSLPASIKKISIEIENKFFEKYFTQNIVGFVEGTRVPDSFIVFSAHYDHLGRMGQEAYFPGANDNASGTAMLLSLASYYGKNPQPYSIAFIGFGAEEAGLIGSKFFTLHPLFPLEKIRFLVNLDILGTGDEGIMVVNATEYVAEFEKLKKINAEENLLPDIKERGPAKNSDHYYFYEKGVPSFFIYTLGGVTFYHDIYDRPQTLPLTEFEDIFKLLITFTGRLQK